ELADSSAQGGSRAVSELKSASRRALMSKGALLLSVLTGNVALAGPVDPRLAGNQSTEPAPSAVASSRSAVEVVRSIDWNAVKELFPIPTSMPTLSSDDPLEAGFAPEWAERALKGMGAAPARTAMRYGDVSVPADEPPGIIVSAEPM